MFSGLFFSSTADAGNVTRFESETEFKKLNVLLAKLRKKLKEIEAAANEKGGGTIDYRKFVIFRGLFIELDYAIKQYNQLPVPPGEKENIEQKKEFVLGLFDIVNRVLDKKWNDLATHRSDHPDFAYNSIYYGGFAVMLGSVVALWPVSTMAAAASAILIPSASGAAAGFLDVDGNHPESAKLLSAIKDTLKFIAGDLGIEKEQLIIQRGLSDEYAMEFDCPIGKVKMQNPVLCSLDGRTYEDENIRRQLTDKRCSPIDPSKKLQVGQSIDSVLTINRTFKDLIEADDAKCITRERMKPA